MTLYSEQRRSQIFRVVILDADEMPLLIVLRPATPHAGVGGEDMMRPASCALVATCDRKRLLLERALPSIRRQTHPPDLVVIVDDGTEAVESVEIARRLAPIETALMRNEVHRGAAAAWNRGLRHLHRRAFDGYVAILDDDDTWDEDHLAVCLDAASQTRAGAVVSGLRMVVDGTPKPRELIAELSWRDFLTGNPGWQGSNTFVRFEHLMAVGGFRVGMASANDRDLAIRLLKLPAFSLAFTGRWTATWHLSQAGGQLSSAGSDSKLAGLRWFWSIHGPTATEEETEEFFHRAESLFGLRRWDIERPGDDLPRFPESRGDLDV